MTAPTTHPAAQAPRRGRDDRGAVLVIIALVLPVLIILTAFAVDLGRQRSARRTMQARADVIALDLARLLDGRTESQLLADPTTEQAVVASAARNQIDRSKITFEFGQWADPIESGHEGQFNEILGSVVPTAVRVRAQDDISYFFRPGEGHADRSAVASGFSEAAFLIGSKLVTVSTQQATLLNGVLGDAFNTNLALSAATYQGLAGSTVNLGQLATQMGFASPTEMANATVNARQFMLASAQVLQQNGDTAAASVFQTIGASTDQTATLDMGDLMDVSAGGGRTPTTQAGFNAFNLLTGSAYAINGDNAIAVPGVGLGVPGITTSNLSLHVIQKPLLVKGPVGVFGDTSQAQLDFANTLTTNGLTSGLVNLRGTFTIRQSVAGARGTLTNINCGANKSISVGVSPRPVATSVDTDFIVRVAGLPILSIKTTLSATPVGTSDGATFAYPTQFLPQVGSGTMHEAPTAPLGLANLLTVKTTDVTLIGILPLGTTLSGLLSTVNTNILNPLFSSLDTTITGPISTALGLSVGAADVGAVDESCNSVRLVH